MIVIDLVNGDDVISTTSEVQKESHAEKLARFQKLRDDWLRGAPQPQLVPVETNH